MTLTMIDQPTIDIIYARTKFFLWEQRHRRGNDRLFTVEEIAADFSVRPPLGAIVLALLNIGANGELERRGNRVRHA